jgi:hypothetical protein
MVVVKSKADLLQVIGALRSASRFSGRLYRRQKDRDQDSDDRDTH